MLPRRGIASGAAGNPDQKTLRVDFLRWRAGRRCGSSAGRTAAVYGGHKDASAAWAAGVLRLDAWPVAAGHGPEGRERPQDLQKLWQERTAIMVYDGEAAAHRGRPPGAAGLGFPQEAAKFCTVVRAEGCPTSSLLSSTDPYNEGHTGETATPTAAVVWSLEPTIRGRACSTLTG